MRACIAAAFAAALLQGPARADAPQTFVTGWLERCYAAADAAHAQVPLPSERGHGDARFLAGHIENTCVNGPLTICKHSAEPSECLTAARIWMEQERDRIIAQLPATLAEGTSPARRTMIQRYEAFIASDGQEAVPGMGVEDCIGTGTSHPELGLTRAECALRETSMQLGRARGYAQRIVAGILK